MLRGLKIQDSVTTGGAKKRLNEHELFTGCVHVYVKYIQEGCNCVKLSRIKCTLHELFSTL